MQREQEDGLKIHREAERDCPKEKRAARTIFDFATRKNENAETTFNTKMEQNSTTVDNERFRE